MHAASNIICTLLYFGTDPSVFRFLNFSLVPYSVNTECIPNILEDKFVTFNLYTRQNTNSSQILRVEDYGLLESSFIDFRKRTFIFMHGFTESAYADDSQVMKEYLLNNGDYNVIIVDAEILLAGPNYFTAAFNTKFIGKVIARFIDYLVTRGLQLADLHIIGFSLGAHVMGFAGTYLKSGRLPRITGLDPAGPLFYSNLPEDRLDSSDADFVDIIHTSKYYLGYDKPVGHVDFYPNGGGPFQPGCSLYDRMKDGYLTEFVFCDHYRAFKLYAKSLVEPTRYGARQCRTYQFFDKENCSAKPTIYMGIAVNEKARGIFYIDTGDDAAEVK